jgi:uncharacterized membrane protein YeaQ/YmgE (transglycosylase-associated protein family)
MGLITYIIALAVTGLIVGALARLALPGKDPMSLLQTIGIGIAGSFLAGLVVSLIAGNRSGASFPVAVLFSTGLVYLIRRRRGGTFTRAAGAGPAGMDRGVGRGGFGRR